MALKDAKSSYLVSRQSEYHPAVTLIDFQTSAMEVKAEVKGDSTSSPRRSTRLVVAKSTGASSKKRSLSALDDEDNDDGSNLETPAKRKRVKVETSENVVVVAHTSSSPTKKKTSRRPVKHELSKPHPAPPGWEETYAKVWEYRFRIQDVPVDIMGCPTAHHKEITEKNKRFITLVSLMLSPQTKDDKCSLAVENLQRELGGTVSVDAVISTSEERIAAATKPAGFRKKAKYIKDTAQMLRDNFDSDVPKTVDELCTLPGVGEKIAFLTLQVAWGINTGIGVDVHVHRITNRLGWHKPPTKTPDETRLNLQSWLPTELYRDINTLFVGFGQMICLPVSPRCDICPIRDRCPSSRKLKPDEKRREIKFVTDGPKVEISIDDIRTEAKASINHPFPSLDNPRTRILLRKKGLSDGLDMGGVKGEEW